MAQADWEYCVAFHTAAPRAETPQAELEELNRRLAACTAELRRCQTQLFAYERAMLALQQENAELEAKCEALNARLLSCVSASPENAASPLPVQQHQPAAAPPQEAQEQAAQPLVPEPEPAPESAKAPSPQSPAPAAPPKKPAEPPAPKTEPQRRAAQLLEWFDEFLG